MFFFFFLKNRKEEKYSWLASCLDSLHISTQHRNRVYNKKKEGKEKKANPWSYDIKYLDEKFQRCKGFTKAHKLPIVESINNGTNEGLIADHHNT